MNNLVSIIMPVFNAEQFLKIAIQSVLDQSYKNWELLVVNDGSTDCSESIILSFEDDRIFYFRQDNTGVSSARNVALNQMRGDYFCFFDADDVLPHTSLKNRLTPFINNSEIDIVDGTVMYTNANGQLTSKCYKPTFKGDPFGQLIKINETCFFGPSWTIKRDPNYKYKFDTDLHHSEDLWFYISFSKGKLYHPVDEVILHYRQSDNTAMKNLKGLELGYIGLIKRIRALKGISILSVIYLKAKITKIMMLSHAFDNNDLRSALICPLRIILA